MTYYEKLIAEMDGAMAKHPHSTIAMSADTFEILASGKNTAKVASEMDERLQKGQVPVIFQRPKKNQTWIL